MVAVVAGVATVPGSSSGAVMGHLCSHTRLASCSLQILGPLPLLLVMVSYLRLLLSHSIRSPLLIWSIVHAYLLCLSSTGALPVSMHLPPPHSASSVGSRAILLSIVGTAVNRRPLNSLVLGFRDVLSLLWMVIWLWLRLSLFSPMRQSSLSNLIMCLLK